MPADWAGAPHARTLREQLRYWPYTIHQVDETLDVSMIEGRARQILFQGLNAQSITAFVGSGLSASYGRLSWPGWKREQLAVVEQNYQAFIQLAQAALAVKVMLIEATAPLKVPEKTSGIKQGSARRLVYDAVDDDDKDFGQKHRYNCQQWFKYRKRQIENALDQVQHLYATYSRVMAEGNDGFPGGDGLPVIFEIAQQLQDELRRYVPFFIPEKALTSGEKLEPKETKTWPGSLFENLSAAPNESLKALEKIVFPDGRESLIEAFKNMTAKSGEFVPAGEAEVYLGVIKVYIGHLKRYYDVYGQPEAAFDFETLAKLLLVDECAHALITLREGYKSGSEFKGDVAGDRNLAELERHLKVFDPSVLKRNVDGIRDNPDRYKILTPYLLQHFVKQEEKDMSLLELEKLSEDHSDLSPLIKTIQKELAGHLEQARGQQLFLTPSSRFLLATVLALHEKEKRAELVIDANEPGKDRGSLFYPEVRNKDFTSRRSIIANRLDPLAKVVEDLGVRRFITLNYDFEIERYFIDEGFRHFPPSSVRARETKEPENEDYRVDGVGRVLYDQTFERETASNMVRFSVGQNKERAAVFHLHGRATDEDALVITERDYMELYLLEDEQRETVHEGITMAFSSAPLLFMGLGMSEADLLRPLRQFMSNEDRTSGYSSVALLPAEYPLADRTKFSAALYLRYGVHTIFYGGGVVSVGEEDAQGEKASVNIDWLCTILSIIGSLRKVVSGARKEPAEIPTQLEIAHLVIEACGELGKDKVDHQDKSALLALLGELFPLFEDGKTENAAAKFLNLIKTKPLQDAVFTSVRKSEANRMSPHHDSLSDIDGHLFTSFYTSILTDVLRMMTGGLSEAVRREALQKGGKLKQDGDLSRQLAALEIALNGLHGAFLTSTLNAALAGLEKQWKSWWDKWQDAPPLRLAKFEEMEVPEDAPGLQRYVRHPIENVISPLDDEPPKVPLMRRQAGGGLQVESSWRTGIRAFDTFIEAVAVHRRTAPPTSQHAVAGQRAGRLMFTIAAHRGLGKGTLQSAFVSTRGLLAYQAAAWPVQDERRRSVWISGAAFINFSFATEIASCYDMLAEVLIDQLVRHDKTLAVEQADRRAVLEARYQGVSRLVMLRTLFDAFRDYSARSAPGPHQPRLLIALSALDLLYDDGVCKNEEIRVVLELLTGPDLEDHPIDLIALASEGGVGWPIGGPASERPVTNVQIDRLSIPAVAQEQITERIRNGRIKIEDPSVHSDKPINHVHFARQVSPISLLVDNFPLLSTGLAISSCAKLKKNDEAEKEFNAVVKDRRKTVMDEIDEMWSDNVLPVTAELDKLRRSIGRDTKKKMELTLKAAFGSSDKSLEKLLYDHLTTQFKDQSNWTDIRRYLRYNRFSLTIMLAAAETIILEAPNPLKAATAAQEFILATANKVRNVGEDRREEMVLEAVLAAYSRFHEVGDPDRDIELHQLLIRHIGVIGAPLSSAVIVRLPQLRDYFERIGVEPETSRRRFISRTLTALAHRGLIFRISPHPRLKALEEETLAELEARYGSTDGLQTDASRPRELHEMAVADEGCDLRLEDPAWPAAEEHRYALHRIVQRFAVSMLGAAMRDPVAGNRFAPTIYAAMPSTGTRLSRDSYSFLRQLLIALSQYPDLAHGDTALRPWLHASNPRRTRVQALRAALSLARSTLSVATISRFSGYDQEKAGFPKRGYMETYKVRLRWIIRLAWELSKEGEGDVQPTGTAVFNHPSPSVQALYRDEVVWVYNELGVIALAQGSLTEALAFLRQAAEYNEPIEGRSRNGPIFDHIDLNHAIVQIERGRLDSARTRLTRILVARQNSACVIHATAQGYMCLLNHLTGQTEGLERAFRKVTRSLERIGDARASAIMLAHRGRFLIDRDVTEAKRCLQAAQAKAETGGHEDIRWQIEVARIAMEHRHIQPKPGHLQRLKEIEAYGRRMDIWNIQVDALKLRAEILLDQGETGSAGADAIRALSISTRLHMTLRANSVLTLYAKILLYRGQKEGALVQAKHALELAKSIGYNIETSRAQQVATACRSLA